jgi:hypothetical protein
MSSPLDEVMYHSDSSSDNSKQPKNNQSAATTTCLSSGNSLTSCPLPPTFYNEQGTTRPFYLFPLFLFINIITMADRAIIPGASQEFLGFLGSAHDSPGVVKDNPDAGLVREIFISFSVCSFV